MSKYHIVGNRMSRLIYVPQLKRYEIYCFGTDTVSVRVGVSVGIGVGATRVLVYKISHNEQVGELKPNLH